MTQSPSEIAEQLSEACRRALLQLSPTHYMTASEAGAFSATLARLRVPPLTDDMALAHDPLVTRDYLSGGRPVFKLTGTGASVREHLEQTNAR